MPSTDPTDQNVRWTEQQPDDPLLDSARSHLVNPDDRFVVKPWNEIMRSLSARQFLAQEDDTPMTEEEQLRSDEASYHKANSVFATAADHLVKGVDKQANAPVKSGGPTTKPAKMAAKPKKEPNMARKPSNKTTEPTNGTADQPLPDTVDDSNETHTDRVNDSDHADETRLPPADDVNPDGADGQDAAVEQTKQERDAQAAVHHSDAPNKVQRAADRKAAKERAAIDKLNAKAAAAADRAAARQARAAAQKYDDNGQPIFDPVMSALRAKVAAGVYVKGATGQYRSNNDLALALDRVQPANVVKMARALLGDTENKYSHMNMGQQSMNYRNRLRGAIKADKLTLADVVKYITDHGLAIPESEKAVPTGNHPVGTPANPEQGITGGATGLEIPTHAASGEVTDNSQEAVDASIGARAEQQDA